MRFSRRIRTPVARMPVDIRVCCCVLPDDEEDGQEESHPTLLPVLSVEVKLAASDLLETESTRASYSFDKDNENLITFEAEETIDVISPTNAGEAALQGVDQRLGSFQTSPVGTLW
eukprot:CAMPEP_0194491512 /NCGR_PEP_ID=MMETSP0253-20130528/10374_1 /TAXON_ID=2966 /ORGANISM="Noctiluca scintillans" /LENGTH=115 /DNA_ID=CAMNT_0039332255 /DNA_START=118 /DNA_END=466 /DNA_ORIENTATION=-